MAFNPNSWTQNLVLQLSSPNAASVVASASYTAGTVALVGGGPVILKNPAYLQITAAANESANVFTITGIDVNGNNFTVTQNGPNATTAPITVAVKQVNSVRISANTAGVISIGNIAATYSQWVPIDKNANEFTVGMGVYLSSGATLNYTVQFAYLWPDQGIELVKDDTNLASETTSGTTYLVNEPYDAARLLINSYTNGQAIFMVRPTGLSSAGYPVLSN